VNANPHTKRKPLRDVQPSKLHAHQDSTICLGDYSDSPRFQERYKLLKSTISKVVLMGGLVSLMPAGKPTALMNAIIERATLDGLYLLREPQTATDWTNGSPAFSDAEIVRKAKCIADGAVKAEKIISRRGKRDESGNFIRDEKGRVKRGYKADLRITHPVQHRDINDNPVQEWIDPVDSFVSGTDGRPINGGRTTDYANAATNQRVAKFQKQLLHEVIAGYLGGKDDAEFLMDYIDGRFPESPETAEMAEFFMEKLKPHAAELEQFRDLYT